MAKPQALSIDEWNELLSPYGYTDIAINSVPMLGRGKPVPVRIQFSMVLCEDESSAKLDEWARRSACLDKAKKAVQAVQDKGFFLDDAPEIVFGGRYNFPFGNRPPIWLAEVRLEFEVYA